MAKKEEIRFDRKNYRKHSDENKAVIARSLDECGAGRSILIDREGEIIAGNGVYEQAKAKGIPVRVVETDGSELVVVKRTDLATDDERRRRLALADNAASDLSEWDVPNLTADFDLDELGSWGVELNLGEGEEDEIEKKRKEFQKRMEEGDLDEDDPEYQDFLQKFEAKKTTDDCYTPEVVYEAIADYVADHYHESRTSFVRPFYPKGDYQREKYPQGCVVVDNPPFSILSEIVSFYSERKIKFFLFAPYLTCLGSGKHLDVCAICIDNSITYENGAVVGTSFLTNLEPNVRAKSDPVLSKIIKDANEENLKQLRKELPKYSFPDNVVTATFIGRCSKYGVPFSINRSECVTIGALDAMKAEGKGIFGSGLLVSEKAAAEKAAAHRWALSDREKAIIQDLK